jgi:hypothetical protein
MGGLFAARPRRSGRSVFRFILDLFNVATEWRTVVEMWEVHVRACAVLWMCTLACKPSNAELAERAAKADSAELARIHAERVQREAKAAADASAVTAHDRARATNVNTASGGCGITAERAMARMAACGLNVDGFTPETLCNKMGQPKLLFLASRECAELKSIVLGSE